MNIRIIFLVIGILLWYWANPGALMTIGLFPAIFLLAGEIKRHKQKQRAKKIRFLLPVSR